MSTDTPRPERVTLTDVERGYAFIGDGIHWRGRWYSELAVESIVSRRLAAREQALREEIATEIESPVVKPPEPQGLGAVVRDRDGVLWVRCDESTDPWCRTDGEGNFWVGWRALDAVEVLSPGVEL